MRRYVYTSFYVLTITAMKVNYSWSKKEDSILFINMLKEHFPMYMTLSKLKSSTHFVQTTQSL